MSDTINRQDAINTALEFFVEFLGGAFHEDAQKILIKRMNDLPSAERTGKWISDWNRTIKMIDGCPDGSCHCSNCGEWLVASDEYLVKGVYCPDCGARMMEGEEE